MKHIAFSAQIFRFSNPKNCAEATRIRARAVKGVDLKSIVETLAGSNPAGCDFLFDVLFAERRKDFVDLKLSVS